MTPVYWPEATAHLSAACPVMARLIASYPGEGPVSRGDAFYTLLRSIVGQQISVRAADAVWGRLEKKLKPMTPEKLLRMRESTLRSCGLSGQKVAYARNLARYFVCLRGALRRPAPTSLRDAAVAALSPEGEDDWASLSDAEVIAELTSIKGIGRWTAEMFLIFHLQRPDVLPLQDLGLIKAMQLHCGIGEKPSRAELTHHAQRWQPYRSVATWYLWRSLDPVPVEY